MSAHQQPREVHPRAQPLFPPQTERAYKQWTKRTLTNGTTSTTPVLQPPLQLPEGKLGEAPDSIARTTFHLPVLPVGKLLLF